MNIRYYFQVIQLIHSNFATTRKNCGVFHSFEEAVKCEQVLKLKSNSKFFIEAHEQY